MTNTFKYSIDASSALDLALSEARVPSADCITRLALEAGLWDVEFTACGLDYVCYVDAADGSVPGLSFEPSEPELDAERGRRAA